MKGRFTRESVDLENVSGHEPGMPHVAAVVVGRDRPETLRLCLESLLSQKALISDLVYVDTGSRTQAVSRVVSQFKSVKTASVPGGNPQIGRNLGASLTDSKWILFCDDDVEVSDGAVKKLLDTGQAFARAGIIGGRRLEPRGETTEAVHLSSYTLSSPIGLPREGARSDWIGTIRVYTVRNMYLIRRSVFTAVGGWNPDLFIQFDEVDLCNRIYQAGFEVLCSGQATYIDHTANRLREEAAIPEIGLSRRELTVRNSLYVMFASLPLDLLTLLVIPVFSHLLARSIVDRSPKAFLHGIGSFAVSFGNVKMLRRNFPPAPFLRQLQLISSLLRPRRVG